MERINSFEKLTHVLEDVYATNQPYDKIRDKIFCILESVNLTGSEVSKYTFFDSEKPYTRNLVATDGKHFSLLVLCWTPGKGSKIHNHPCDGCFIKTLSGCVKETKYSTDLASGDICPTGTKFFCEGQVSYMCDDMGLHKVENSCSHTGAVTLHLYTPPFRSCKVWAVSGAGELARAEVGLVGFFSMYGRRTPQSEGRPGAHAKLLVELVQKVPKAHTTSTALASIQ